MLGEPTPADADPTGERYCFERHVRKDEAGKAEQLAVPVMDEAELMDLLRNHDAL